jgi:carboxypeptidase C (cathepsin A)
MIKMIWLAILATLAATSTASIASQLPLIDPAYDTLGASAGIRTLTLDSHPNHSLTIKAHSPKDPSIKSDGPRLDDVCPGATSGYTGYLHSGDKHFYFAYFESRANPEKDPLVLWLNGGPGCSSMTGLFMELGPCTVNEDGESARENPNSWVGNAGEVSFFYNRSHHYSPPETMAQISRYNLCLTIADSPVITD